MDARAFVGVGETDRWGAETTGGGARDPRDITALYTFRSSASVCFPIENRFRVEQRLSKHIERGCMNGDYDECEGGD